MSEKMPDLPTSEELDKQLADLVAPVQKQVASLEEARANLIRQREDIDAKITKLKRVIRPIVGPENPRSKGPRTQPRSSEKLVDKAEEFIKEWFGKGGNEFISNSDLCRGIGVSSSVATSIMRDLREDREVVRFVRQDGNRKLYKLMGDD